MFSGFTLGLILSLRKLRGFLLYGFPKENSLCRLSLVIISMHVIISDKILRSYCLNDKNLTGANPTGRNPVIDLLAYVSRIITF